jgi:dihydroorotase
MHVHLRTPGYEDAETLETGLQAAIAGGVTAVGMMPNTLPVMDSVDMVVDVRNRGNSLGLSRVEPVPCVTVQRAGETCTDLEGFAREGITCFSDDGSPVKSDEALLDAFHRVSAFNGVIVEHPEVVSLAAGGAVNLGRASDKTGEKGIPESAEYADVKRCIDVLADSGTDARLHLTHLSSPRSIRLVAGAAEQGLRVTCDVTPHHLSLSEDALINMGSVAKMNPPLRSEKSREELVKMTAKGMVTAIASDHAPHTASKKKPPLSAAAFGITGLETLLPVVLDVLGREAGVDPLNIVQLVTTAPADVLNIPRPEVAPGKPLNMVLFDPLCQWKYSHPFSLSSNSPFLNKTLVGKVLRVWYRRELFREGEFV